MAQAIRGWPLFGSIPVRLKRLVNRRVFSYNVSNVNYGWNSALKAFLMANRAEVKRMCITEYNEVKTLADEREEGRMGGEIKGMLKTLKALVKKGLISEERAAEEAHMSVSEFHRRAELA